MRARLRRWFAPPPPDRPGDVLRWVRRVSVAGSLLMLLFAAQLWAEDASPPWVLLGAAALGVLNASTMGPAIRRADARPAKRTPEGRRRAERVQSVFLALVVVGGTLAGYVSGGTGVAVLAFVLASGSTALVWRWARSWMRKADRGQGY